MKYRCTHCTELFLVGESSSLYPQSFCSKGCEVEAVICGSEGRNFLAMLETLGMQVNEEPCLVN